MEGGGTGCAYILYTSSCVCLYVYVYIHLHAYTCIHIHTHIYTYITSSCVCLYVYVRIHIYTYTYIHIDTHVHTYISCISIRESTTDIRSWEDCAQELRRIERDTRIWEVYNATSHSAPLLFRHYIKDIHRLTQLDRIQMSANEIVSTAKVQLARVCTEADDGSQLWQCVTETFIQNAQGHVILHLHRESLLVKHEP